MLFFKQTPRWACLAPGDAHESVEESEAHGAPSTNGKQNRWKNFFSLPNPDDNPRGAYQDSGKMQPEKEQSACQEAGPAEACALLHFDLSPLKPGFHFPHSLFPGIALPEKMSSQTQKHMLCLRLYFPGNQGEGVGQAHLA